MNNSIQIISYTHLALMLFPVILVVAILWKWTLDYRNALYALSRMLLQLMIIGYFLTYIFESDSALFVIIILAVMVIASSWIALGTIREYRHKFFKNAFISIAIGGGLIFLLVIIGVLDLDPWYFPQYTIPLAGMIFANAMNSVSLAAERLIAELKREVDFKQARDIAFNASLIPIINSLFAVGLVSLPGMMTGQILSGVPPLIAARYQIMVMCMIFASAGISTACFLILSRADFVNQEKI